MKRHLRQGCFVALIVLLTQFAAADDEIHPLMTSEYWGNVGVYFSVRDFDASASGSIGEVERGIDFESRTGLGDKPDLFMAEVGWQFSPNWGLAVQFFESERSGSATLTDSIEWQDLVFDVGVRVDATSNVEITRLFFARRIRDDGPHSLRLGAGLHWLALGASLAGEATLGDNSREFRRSVVSADIPMPNIGAWYSYSPSRRWLFNARADWLSASVDKYKGGIWNVSAGVNFSPWDHAGLGISYQFFELDGQIREDSWRGEIRTRFTGPFVYVSGFW